MSGAPVGFPFVNARRGISELSLGVDPFNPESDAQARGREVEPTFGTAASWQFPVTAQ